MNLLIFIIANVYTLKIMIHALRIYRKRKNIKVGDICSVYIGEIRIKAVVLSVSSIIEVKVLNRVVSVPRRLIYA